MVLTSSPLAPYNEFIMKNPKKIGKVGIVVIIFAAVLAMAWLLFLNNKLASTGTSTDTQAKGKGNAYTEWKEKQNLKDKARDAKLNKNEGRPVNAPRPKQDMISF